MKPLLNLGPIFTVYIFPMKNPAEGNKVKCKLNRQKSCRLTKHRIFLFDKYLRKKILSVWKGFELIIKNNTDRTHNKLFQVYIFVCITTFLTTEHYLDNSQIQNILLLDFWKIVKIRGIYAGRDESAVANNAS